MTIKIASLSVVALGFFAGGALADSISPDFKSPPDQASPTFAHISHACPQRTIAACHRSSIYTSTLMAASRSIWISGSILDPWPHRGAHG